MKSLTRAAVTAAIVLSLLAAVTSLSQVGVPEGVPVLKLERVIDLSNYGSPDSLVISRDGCVAVADGWSIVILMPNGSVHVVDTENIGVYPAAVGWYGDMLVVADRAKTVLLNPWTGELLGEGPGAMPVPYIVVAGDYAIVGNATIMRVFALTPSSIDEIASVNVRELIDLLGFNLTEPAMFEVESAAMEGDRLVFVGDLGFQQHGDYVVIGVLDGDRISFFRADEVGLEDITDIPAGAGLVGVGDLLIYFASGTKVALINATSEGVDVLDVLDLGCPYSGLCTGIGSGMGVGNEYAVLIGSCTSFTDANSYTTAFIVRREGTGLVLDHTETLGGSLIFRGVRVSSGPYLVTMVPGDVAYLFKAVTSSPYPPAPSLVITEDDGVVTINATASTDKDGAIKGMVIDWGDGRMETYDTLVATHKYSSLGTYEINITLTDTDGNTNTRLYTVEVREVEAISTTTTTTTTPAQTTTPATSTTTSATTTTTTYTQTTTSSTTTATTTTQAATDIQKTTTTTQGTTAAPAGGPQPTLVIIAVVAIVAIALAAALITRRR